MSLAALSETNVGDIVFAQDCDDIPVFHPNLVLLFSRCILEGICTHLTTDQQRLWHRYIYAYNPDDWLLKCLDAFLGSFTTEGSIWDNPWIKFYLDLPIASKTNLGIMEVGDGLKVRRGHVDIDMEYIAERVLDQIPVATKTSKGVVQIGDHIDVTKEGIISVPVASKTMLGVARGGENIEVTNGRFDAKGGSLDEIPLMTHTIRGGAKLRDGTTLGDVELDENERMFVDTTPIDDKLIELTQRVKKMEEEPEPEPEEEPYTSDMIATKHYIGDEFRGYAIGLAKKTVTHFGEIKQDLSGDKYRAVQIRISEPEQVFFLDKEPDIMYLADDDNVFDSMLRREGDIDARIYEDGKLLYDNQSIKWDIATAWYWDSHTHIFHVQGDATDKNAYEVCIRRPVHNKEHLYKYIPLETAYPAVLEPTNAGPYTDAYDERIGRKSFIRYLQKDLTEYADGPRTAKIPYPIDNQYGFPEWAIQTLATDPERIAFWGLDCGNAVNCKPTDSTRGNTVFSLGHNDFPGYNDFTVDTTLTTFCLVRVPNRDVMLKYTGACVAYFDDGYLWGNNIAGAALKEVRSLPIITFVPQTVRCEGI